MLAEAARLGKQDQRARDLVHPFVAIAVLIQGPDHR